MALSQRLSGSAPRRLSTLVAAVLLAHVIALQWASRLYAQASLLKPMQPTLYTRLLTPQEPPPVVAAATPAAPARPARPPGRMEAAPPAAPVAQRAASSPAQPETPVVEKPVTAASAAQAAASAPVIVAAAASASAASAPASAEAFTPSQAASAAAASAQPGASAPSATVADAWPSDTLLRYRLGGRLRSGELHGDARVLWQRDGTRYQVRMELNIPLMASLTMTSQGEVGTTLMPQVYEEARNGKPRGLRVGENAITLANGTTVPRPPGVQDTASQFVELSQRFATGRERLEVGRSVTFWMARPGGVDRWTYDVVEREVLSTRMGAIEAFHLKPRPLANPRGNITAEMWFAPKLQHLPVRIRVAMGEEAVVDLLVEGIEQR